MKHSFALLACLVLISSSGFQSGVALDQKASPTKTIQLADQDLKTDADRNTGSQSAHLIAPYSSGQDPVSPSEIKQYIEEHQKDECVSLAAYWKRLGIDTEEWEKYGTCEAAIFELALGRGEATTVMMRLYDQSGWSMGGTRYLFFKPFATAHQTEWRLLGYLDIEDQRYEVPEHRVITSGADRWLLFTVLATRGSGYSLHCDEWYEIDDDGVRLVLSYPSGKSSTLSVRVPTTVLEASSKIISATTEADRTRVAIEFTATYVLYAGADSDDNIQLWAKTQSAVFARSSRQERFRLDARQSRLSDKEFDAIYDGEGPTNSEILRYNFYDLERIATGANERAKAWLSSYLGECEDTNERERLLDALAR